MTEVIDVKKEENTKITLFIAIPIAVLVIGFFFAGYRFYKKRCKKAKDFTELTK